MTTIKILSHASLLVRTEKASVIVDPWLLGSAYWRSWWNYPKAEFDEKELASVDAVVISHIHWDHWHGPTLKKFFKGKKVIVGDDPNPRSRKDLKQIGFSDINIVKHGKYVDVSDIRIHFYNFGLLLNDSAIVLEASGTKILNANDAKLAGASLRNLVKKHAPFDFALRSHSSANSRICFSVEDDDSFVSDDRLHYFRSFKLFMDAVQPRYAIPFASNHCHLQDEVLEFNGYVSKPNELEEFLNANEHHQYWKLVTMLPGSSWTKGQGFSLANQDAFDDYEEKIEDYYLKVKGRLEHYRAREEKLEVAPAVFDKFKAMARKSSIGGLSGVRVVLTKPSGLYKSMIFDGGDLHDSREVSTNPEIGVPVVTLPAIVFRDAVVKNMFHHAGISKRCRYRAVTQGDLRHLQRFISGLERLELVGEGDFTYWARLCSRYLARWRDVGVYVLAVFYKVVKRYPIYLVEEAILRKHSGISSRDVK